MGYAFYKGKGDWAGYHGLEKEKGSPGKWVNEKFINH